MTGDDFAKRLVRARLAMACRRGVEVSRRDLADALGVDYSTVQRWETGRTEPDSVEMRRIAPLLRATVGWLANGEGEPPSPLPDPTGVATLQQARNRAELQSLPTQPARETGEKAAPKRTGAAGE